MKKPCLGVLQALVQLFSCADTWPQKYTELKLVLKSSQWSFVKSQKVLFHWLEPIGSYSKSKLTADIIGLKQVLSEKISRKWSMSITKEKKGPKFSTQWDKKYWNVFAHCDLTFRKIIFILLVKVRNSHVSNTLKQVLSEKTI